MKAECHFCHHELDTKDKGVHRLVTGWERIRTPGDGVHPLKQRDLTGSYSHAVCLDIYSPDGLSMQASLLP